MRILWLCNIMLPAIARELKLPYSEREGWLTGIYERFVKESASRVELGICFPLTGPTPEAVMRPPSLRIGRVLCYGFWEEVSRPEWYDSRLEKQFNHILSDFQPDIVHIFGTEFPHAWAMAKVWDRPAGLLLGIQGLCHKIAQVYTEGLPEKVIHRATLRDRLKRDSIKAQQNKFAIRGQYEKELILKAGHITGRTRFDREATAVIHPEAVYHAMNETMRACFYSGRWDGGRCEKGSIFLSQGDYPIKGLHYMLSAMPAILSRRPDACLYVAGNPIIGPTLKDVLRISSYGVYIKGLIRELHLEDKVVFLGKLDGEGMKERLLGSSIFVCPSILENSPNALGEAMLLGVPSVAAATGGIPDLMIHGREGILYEPGNIAALSAGVLKAWEEETSEALSAGGAARGAAIHDPDTNYERLMEIYHEINLAF